MKKLLFVYNANSDTLSVTLDFLHKIISPNTYQCSLCAITYRNFGIRQEWKKFLKELPIETIFLHKDEFRKIYPDFATEYPVILQLKDDILTEFIGVLELNKLTLEKLMMEIRRREEIG